MAGELAFFELGVGDAERGRAFYSGLFGWSLEPGPSGGGGFAIATPNVPGGIHGGDAGAAPGDDESVARFGRFRLCRDDQGSPFGLHQRPATG